MSRVGLQCEAGVELCSDEDRERSYEVKQSSSGADVEQIELF